MPRRPSFRRDTDLQNEVRRVNKLVQNKQSRLRTQKELEVTSVGTHQYKEFNSRKEINQYLNKMNRFLDRNANFQVENKHGVEMQYRDVMEIEKTHRRVNKDKKRVWDKIKDLPFKHRGKPTELTVEQQANPVVGMKDPRYGDLNELKFNPNRFRSKKEFEDYKHRQMSLYHTDWMNERNELYRKNYMKALDKAMGDSQAMRELKKKIMSMPLDDFIQAYYTENNANIRFIYDSVERAARVNELKRVWGIKEKRLVRSSKLRGK